MGPVSNVWLHNLVSVAASKKSREVWRAQICIKSASLSPEACFEPPRTYLRQFTLGKSLDRSYRLLAEHTTYGIIRGVTRFWQCESLCMGVQGDSG